MARAAHAAPWRKSPFETLHQHVSDLRGDFCAFGEGMRDEREIQISTRARHRGAHREILVALDVLDQPANLGFERSLWKRRCASCIDPTRHFDTRVFRKLTYRVSVSYIDDQTIAAIERHRLDDLQRRA